MKLKISLNISVRGCYAVGDGGDVEAFHVADEHPVFDLSCDEHAFDDELEEVGEQVLDLGRGELREKRAP